ncbi:mechanosensitive ion channel family protein [Thiotrichales bacterium 19S9-12]|nr:mechanosensitive ion channel family protein [Thiotrichales bacterium 19S9-11]MCF6810824.1 mechanosensitive ion channel family protein [Thiotrichales bacterium 19S9-12]
MFDTILANELYSNVLATVILVIVLVLIYFMVHALLIKPVIDVKRNKRKRVRVLYTLVIIAIVLLAKIWVNGFVSLLAILSLVSAALVITNKELIMNSVGSLIINWRSLFIEGDFIQIDQYRGFVAELGPLFFKMYEASEGSTTRASGKVIKIPNGLVMTYPVMNYSRKRNVIEYVQKWLFKPDNQINRIKGFLTNHTQEVLDQYYQNDTRYTNDYIQMRSKLLAQTTELKVYVDITLVFDEKRSGILASVHYYCFPTDYEYLKTQITERIFEQLKHEDDLNLFFHIRG